MTFLFILNDPPYGTEKSYNALRLALQVAKREHAVKIFLMADAAGCAVAGQVTPNGYYNLERMLQSISKRGGAIGVCGTCMDARGIKAEALIEGTARGTMELLTDWTLEADKVIVF